MGIWDESSPATPGQVPTLGGIGSLQNEQQKIQQALQQYLQMQQQNVQRAGIAGAARPGTPAPSNIPTAVPVGGQTPQAGLGQSQQPQQRAPIPTGVPGTPGSAFPAKPPEVQPAQQVPYAATGKGAWAANAVYGVSNLLARKRQEDQQKEYTQAENLWTQILNAQANMQKAAEEGKDDPFDKQVIDTILSDKKNVKMIQDALGTLTVDPSQQQGQQQDPVQQAQAAGAKGALQKVGRTLGGLFDPRTQAQRMPSGQSMPAPGTPGGVMWNYPTPTTTQKEEALIKQKIEDQKLSLANDPEMVRQVAERQLTGMTAYQQAEIKAREEQIQMQRDWHQGWVDMNAKRYEEAEKERKRKDDLEHQDRQARIAATAAAKKVDPDQLKFLVNEFIAGRLTKADLPKINDKNLRDAVFAAMKGHPFANPISPRQQENLQYLDQSARILPDARAKLEELVKQYPDLDKASSSNWQNFKTWAANRGRLGMYSAGAYVDPSWTQYYEYVGTIEARGLAPFLQVARNRNMLDIALVHVPKPTDTPAQLRTKLDWFEKYIIKDTMNEINATRWGTNVMPYPGDLPMSPPPGASPTGGNYVDVSPEDLDATVPK